MEAPFSRLAILCSATLFFVSGLIALMGNAQAATPAGAPTNNVAPQLPIMCQGATLDNSAGCIQSALHDINYARSLEGVKPMILPTNYASLPLAEQALVVVNLERSGRGLAPWAGLNSSLDANALQAAQAGTDPHTVVNSAGLISGGSQVLWANYIMMYEDGWDSVNNGSFNADCTSPTAWGCWMHRTIILQSYNQPCTAQPGCAAMGAATAVPSSGPFAGYPDITWVFVKVDSISQADYPVDDFNNASLAYPSSAPPVLMSASSSAAAPGTSVTLEGLYFTGTTSVLFGSTRASAVQVLDDGTLSVTVPPAAPGTVTLKVTTPVGATTMPFSVQGSPYGVLTNPANGARNVDTTVPFTWSPGQGVDGYWLLIGTSQGGSDQLNTGQLPATTTSYQMAAPLPTGQTLWARLYTVVGGSYDHYQDVSFTAAPGVALLNNPVDGAANVDSTLPITWSPAVGQGIGGYFLRIGTTPGGGNLYNSAMLPASATSYVLNYPVPAGTTLWLRLFTEMNGSFSRWEDVSFSVAAGSTPVFTSPSNQATNVSVSTGFTWIPSVGQGVGGYWVRIGTTRGGGDVASSGMMSATQTSYQPATALPAGTVLWARLYAMIGGVGRRVNDIQFTIPAPSAPAGAA